MAQSPGHLCLMVCVGFLGLPHHSADTHTHSELSESLNSLCVALSVGVSLSCDLSIHANIVRLSLQHEWL